MADLLPCPFCGGEGVLHDDVASPFVSCSECEADGAWCKSAIEAVASWNTRHECAPAPASDATGSAPQCPHGYAPAWVNENPCPHGCAAVPAAVVRNGWCSDCGGINEHYDHCVMRRAAPASACPGKIFVPGPCEESETWPGHCGKCGAAVQPPATPKSFSDVDRHMRCDTCGRQTWIDSPHEFPACSRDPNICPGLLRPADTTSAPHTPGDDQR